MDGCGLYGAIARSTVSHVVSSVNVGARLFYSSLSFVAPSSDASVDPRFSS